MFSRMATVIKSFMWSVGTYSRNATEENSRNHMHMPGARQQLTLSRIHEKWHENDERQSNRNE